MTQLNGDGYISIVQLIVYIPCFFLALLVCIRHGFKRTSGWLYTLLFCVIRIAGAVCQLLTYHSTSSGLIEAVVIIGSIGLAPLLLAALGMLHRFHDFVNTTTGGVISNLMIRIIQIVITIALVLAIVGGAKSNINVALGTVDVQKTSKAGIILFVIGLIAIMLVTLVSFTRRSYVPKKEKIIPIVIAVVMPFLVVRLIYSILIIFVNNSTFNLIDGSVAAKAAMETIEEFIATFLYLGMGFYLPKLNKEWVKSVKNGTAPLTGPNGEMIDNNRFQQV